MQETLDQLITSLQLQQATIQDQRDMQLQQQRALIQVSSTLADLSAQIHADQTGGPGHSVSAAVAPPPLPLTPALAGLAPPPLYDGNPKKCRSFITQCRLILRLQAAHLPDDETAVAYIITRLTGRALEWVTPLVERRDPVCLSVPAFLDRLQTVFQGETGRRASLLRLMSLRQGNRSVSDYAIEFRTLASDSEWTDAALPVAFYQGLREAVKDEMVNRDWGTTLDRIITLATSIDRRLAERGRERRNHAPFPSAPTARWPDAPTTPPPLDVDEPMQLGRARLPCSPVQGSLVSTKASPCSTTRCLFPITICWRTPKPGRYEGQALVDSGAAMNLIDIDLATQLQLPVTRCNPPRAVRGLDGSPLGSGRVLFQTKPLLICLGPNHIETMTFYLTTTPHDPIVLCYPWLTAHEPHIDWTTGTIKQWGRQCVRHNPRHATAANHSCPQNVAMGRLGHTPQPKPCPQKRGPFRVPRRIGPVSYLRQAHPSPLQPPQSPPPSPQRRNGSPTHTLIYRARQVPGLRGGALSWPTRLQPARGRLTSLGDDDPEEEMEAGGGKYKSEVTPRRHTRSLNELYEFTRQRR
uniref:Retrotransposon gag domain-containing protein n=1 Tax=Denticeps clupeoides TaxID=299321 RepID=A0AAY4CY98_9TELE